MAGEKLSADILQNAARLEALFEKDATFILRFVQNRSCPGLTFALCYCAGMIDSALIANAIIKPLVLSELAPDDPNLLQTVMTKGLYTHKAEPSDTFEEIIQAVTGGDTAVLLPGAAQALIMSTQGFPLRSISEPDAEKVLSGPKEGFCESMIVNLSLLHRRLKTNDLKIEMRTFGERTATKACVCYLASVCDPEILAELNRRLDTIHTDGALDVNTLAEWIRDNRHSSFRAIDYTERPDVAAGKLLEGRVAVFLDGTPMVLTLPYLFIENFQSNEDYYMGSFYASFARILRISGYFLSVLTPAVFIAITTYNHEILPTPLLISMTRERQNVPLPLGLELIMMLLVFDLLREAGVRMPSNIGQAMSIVGALVLGQAAVQAKIASSLVIIIVAFTGITSLLVPKMSAPLIVTRASILLLALFLGFPGLLLGFSLLLAHILGLRSFGMAQVGMTGALTRPNIQDTAVRLPLDDMPERPPMAAGDHIRMQKPPGRWWR